MDAALPQAVVVMPATSTIPVSVRSVKERVSHEFMGTGQVVGVGIGFVRGREGVVVELEKRDPGITARLVEIEQQFGVPIRCEVTGLAHAIDGRSAPNGLLARVFAPLLKRLLKD